MASQPQPRLTLQEFLAMEETSQERHEYHSGEVFEILGADPRHGELCLRTISLLSSLFPECRAFESSVLVYSASEDKAMHPDGTLVCSNLEIVEGLRGVGVAITNPHLVVEVLSPTTADYDAGTKAQIYRSIPALRTLLVVSASKVDVTHFWRGEGDSWTLRRYNDLGQSLSIEGRSLSLASIYQGIL